MTTIDLYTFSDRNPRNIAPRIMFQYLEKDTGNFWVIWAAAGHAYLYRLGDKLGQVDLAERKHDAELMVRRLQASLLISKKGLFKYEFEGMWTLDKIQIERGISMVNCVLPSTDSEKYDEDVVDWFRTFSTNTLLRRVAEDAYMAAAVQQESIFFLYRGFEWLKEAVGNPSWRELGSHIDIPQENINYIKRTANNPKEAARHAAQSGMKSYFGGEVCSSWVCGLLHGIVHVRCSTDPDFEKKVKKHGDPWPV